MLPRRHAHCGPWASGPLPAGLAAGLQRDALTEGAELAILDRAIAFRKLADIAGPAGRRLGLDPAAWEETRRWTRDAADRHDDVPAHAFPAGASPQPGRLAQRDFDLGHGLGLLLGGAAPPAATAVLLTSGDSRADWLRAGLALHRLPTTPRAGWVFASLHTQPLEASSIRALIQERLAPPGIRRC